MTEIVSPDFLADETYRTFTVWDCVIWKCDLGCRSWIRPCFDHLLKDEKQFHALLGACSSFYPFVLTFLH